MCIIFYFKSYIVVVDGLIVFYFWGEGGVGVYMLENVGGNVYFGDYVWIFNV